MEVENRTDTQQLLPLEGEDPRQGGVGLPRLHLSRTIHAAGENQIFISRMPTCLRKSNDFFSKMVKIGRLFMKITSPLLKNQNSTDEFPPFFNFHLI